jgi:hypothetical protein
MKKNLLLMLNNLVFIAPTCKKGRGSTILTRETKEQQHLKSNNKSWADRYLRSCSTNVRRITTLVALA